MASGFERRSGWLVLVGIFWAFGGRRFHIESTRLSYSPDLGALIGVAVG